MQCSSYSAMYYHARDLTSGANGYSWHIYDSSGDERGFNVPMPQCDQYSVYDREVMMQIMHNHEATFRYQVQELHRLYRRQRDLMEETRAREIFSQHLQSRTSESIHSSSRAGAELSQKPSPATDWLLGNHLTSSRNAHWPRSFIAENFQNDSFIRRNSEHDAKFMSSSSRRNGNNVIDLEFPADVYGDDQVKQFKGTDLSEASELICLTPEKFSTFQPVDHSNIGSSRTWGLSDSSSDIKRSNCCIDLNEPLQLEAFTGYDETVYSEECASVKATPESKLLKSGESSDGVNSLVAIDLNSVPLNCFSDVERNLESPPSINREAKVVLGCSYEDRSTVQSDDSGSFSKTGSFIDLNTDVVDDSLPQSCSTLEIKSVEYAEPEGPVSPENEERSPPRGKSEDIQLETPLSSEGEREPSVELETTAAQTLVMIYSSGNLSWFAEIVSSNTDELENEAMERETEAAEDYQGDENGLNPSRFNKGKGKGNVSRRSVKGEKKGKKQRKDMKTDLPNEESVVTAPPKRRAGKNPCAKPRKYSKLSPSEVTKKPVSSILKQSDAVVQRWGKTRRRGGSRRRRVNEVFIMS